MTFEYDITQDLIDQINRHYDKVIIEAFERKGITFLCYDDMVNFIRDYCHIKQYEDTDTYYINDMAFLRIYNRYDTIISSEDFTTQIQHILNSYEFL